MDKPQKELLKSYYRARGIAVAGRYRTYQPYEYTPYALDSGIMNLDALPIKDKHEVYEKNASVRKYIQPYIDNYEKNAKGFLRLLFDYKKSHDITSIINFIQTSEFIKGEEATVEEDAYGDVDLGVKEKDLLVRIDLEHEFRYVEHYLNYADDYWDSDEENYMHHSFDGSARAKMERIAKLLGAKKQEIEDFWNEEGELAKFLNDNDLSKVIDTFVEYYIAARSEAQSNAAENALEAFPFTFDSYGYNSESDATLDIDKTIKYFYEHDPAPIKSFDSFLDFVENNNSVSEEHVRDAAYENPDYTDLYFYLNRELDDVLDDFEDPDSEYYQKVQGQHEIQNILKKYGFKLIPKAEDDDPFAVRDQKDKTINVIEWGYGDDEETLQLELEIIYKTDLDKGEKTRRGWILANNIGNYVDQYEIPQIRE